MVLQLVCAYLKTLGFMSEKLDLNEMAHAVPEAALGDLVEVEHTRDLEIG